MLSPCSLEQICMFRSLFFGGSVSLGSLSWSALKPRGKLHPIFHYTTYDHALK